MKLEFTNKEHKEHCKIAGCAHPPVYPGIGQGWCARCRCVAFGGIYEGLTFRDGEIYDLNSNKILTRNQAN